MKGRMTRSGGNRKSSDLSYLDDIEAIELRADQLEHLGKPNSSRFHESESTQRLLLPRDATPSDSISSSGSNIAMISGEEKNRKECGRKRNQFSYCEDSGTCDGVQIEIKNSTKPFEGQLKSGSSAILNEGTDEELIITGFRLNIAKSLLMGVLFILTAGLLWLFLYWMPKVRLRFTHDIVDLEVADTVLVEEEYGKGYVCVYVEKIYVATSDNEKKPILIPEVNGPDLREASMYRFFRNKKVTYIWDPDTHSFFELNMLDNNVQLSFYHQQNGLNKNEQRTRKMVYGPNDIKVPFHSIGTLLVKEVLNPFYVFQIASVILWLADEYYYYAVAIIVMSLGGITSAVYQTRKNQKNLRSTIQSSDVSYVRRVSDDGNDDSWERVSSEDLVPGDVILIPPNGCEMPCDALLLFGTAIVNESMLTGESVPISKTSLQRNRLTSINSTSSFKEEEKVYDPKEHSKHTLFRGTTVIQTRNHRDLDTIAVVIRTGFSTTKGDLVRSILYPSPVDFKFEQDSYRFVGFLTLLAGIGFAYTCIRLIGEKSMKEIFLDAADLITIVIPPALPAAITIGSLYAENRLKRKGIYCISPRTINVSGSINCVCFDKTGTLTEDGLDLMGVVQVKRNQDDKESKDGVLNGHESKHDADEQSPIKGDFVFCNLERDAKSLNNHENFLQGMATCHSLTTIDGKLSGDPIDVIMFEGTEWNLEETSDGNAHSSDSFFNVVKPPHSNASNDKLPIKKISTDEDLSIAIIHQFQFSSERQCMSVVVSYAKAETGLNGTNDDAKELQPPEFRVFCKGSPEKIETISDPSTLPNDFHSILDSYTEKGYRVIALATKLLPPNKSFIKIKRMNTSEVEKDLEFLGFIVLENRIKKETKPVIKQLQNAKVRTIMVTGDHIQTAVSVAKECKMIPSKSQVIFVTAGEESEDAFEGNLATSNALKENFSGSNAAKVTIGNHIPIKDHVSNNRPYITYYKVNIASEPSSSEEASRDVTPIKSKFDGSSVLETDDTFDSLDIKASANNIDIEKCASNAPITFAIDGNSYDVVKKHFPDDADRLRVQATVFARMSPDQKEYLIEELQELGYYVAMCGDGANDCGALRAAHAGISLSEAEASVASPFTSKEPNISCVPEVIREGRCALVTSFGIFKYMAAYSMTQYISVLLLYEIDSNLSDFEFLYIDLFLITIFAFFFGLTKAHEGELAKQPPNNSLIHFLPITSILLQLGAIGGFQVLVYYLTLNQAWFSKYDTDDPTFHNASYSNEVWSNLPGGTPEEYYKETGIDDSEVACWENYSVFSISAFQYTILAYAFSKSVPYRKWVLSNYQLMTSFILLTAFTVYLVIAPARFFQQLFELLIPPVQEFRYILLGIAALNILACVLLEDFVVEVLFQRGAQKLKLGSSKLPYKKVLQRIREQPSWPPISSTKLAENKKYEEDENKDTRKAVLQLENVEILDENYINKYFGSAENDSTTRTLPKNLETKSLRCTKDNESCPSKHQQHEEAAQVLNRSCPPSSNTKVNDVTLNGATSLDCNLHESDNNQVNTVKLNKEKNKEMISNDESLGVEIVISHIKECNR